ncbi:hypothetical protein LSCM1_00651 [Leishmania martiniquensis]|uniref:Uncharacterized protein n=1 Tax=Leishmania martiniquensis TaxID=1580590 RepID=A0A836GC91_9TRYP|nr:hypothetical protein LSCM1_00651 [Leishmania martiniquensis]
MADPRLWQDPTTEAPSAGLRRSFLCSNGQRRSSMAGCTAHSVRCGAARQQPTPISRRPSHATLIQRTLSSSLVLSSDTDLSSLDVPPIDSTAAAEMLVPSPQWGGTSTSHSQHGCGQVPSLTTFSSELRTSLDFAQQLDIEAEKELHALWWALWSATHSEAMLKSALQSRQTQWNPYRPVRGGPEVKAEILRSEVAEFQAMVPRDSLYIRGVAVLPPTSSSTGSVSRADSNATVRNPWPSPIALCGSGEPRKTVTSKPTVAEETLVIDGPSAMGVVSQSAPATSPTLDSPGAVVHDSAWWAVRCAESAAALFHYIWEAAVVPYYASMPSAFFVASRHSDGAATQTSGSLLSFVPLLAARDDRDSSGLVTAFGTTREEVQKTSCDARRHLSPPLSTALPVQKRNLFSRDDIQLPFVETARAQRCGTSVVSHVVAPHDFDISDDSLEVEVLDENIGSSIGGLQQDTMVFTGKKHDQNAATLDPAETRPKRNGQEGHRPSTASVHGANTTLVEVRALDKAPRELTEAATSTAQQRAALDRSQSVSIPATMTVSHSGAIAISSASAGGALFGKPASRREVPLFLTTAKALTNAPRASSPLALRASAHQRLSRLQQQTTDAEGAAFPAEVTAAEVDERPPQRVYPGSGTSQTRGNRAAASSARGKASSAARINSRTASAARASHMGRAEMSLATGTASSAQHALQLLDKRSRSTLRSQVRQRNPSPVSNAARAAEKSKSMMAELSPPQTCASRAQRRGILSPVQLPLHGKQQRAAGQAKKREGSETSAPASFGLSGKMPPSARLGPLREAAVHSASTELRRPAALSSTGIPNANVFSPATRNTSVGARRSGKAPQRSLSKSKCVPETQQRPTTAQR